VNELSNLVALCPNHHWELDHGLLSTEFIRKLAGVELTPGK
jgi:predicted restriction endonuclease